MADIFVCCTVSLMGLFIILKVSLIQDDFILRHFLCIVCIGSFLDVPGGCIFGDTATHDSLVGKEGTDIYYFCIVCSGTTNQDPQTHVSQLGGQGTCCNCINGLICRDIPCSALGVWNNFILTF